MKIAYVTNLFPFKENITAGIFVHRRLKELTKRIQVDIFCAPFYIESKFLLLLKQLLKKPVYQPISELEFDGINYSYVSAKKNFLYFIQKRISLDFLNYVEAKFAEEIAKSFNNWDVIHAHGMYGVAAGNIARYLSQKFSVPYIITLHGSDVNFQMKKRREEYIETFENAAKCIFVSDALLQKAKSYGYSGRNAVIIPNGYDPKIFYPRDREQVRKELGIYEEGYKYVGFVGALSSVKRADKFREIFHEITNREKRVKFILVGDGPLRKKIEKECKDLDLTITGFLPQVEVGKWMNAMDVMILPSRNEGWGCVVLEAQACGTIVVGSSNGGIPEAIGFEEYAVQEGDKFEERFAKKVVEVLETKLNDLEFNKMAEKAKGFTWEEIVRREIEIYKEEVFRSNTGVRESL